VATRPIADFDAIASAWRSSATTRAPHEAGVRRPKRSPSAWRTRKGGGARAPGRAVIVDEGARSPSSSAPGVIAARPEVRLRLARARTRARDITSDPRYKSYWQTYYQLMGRKGISPEDAKEAVLRKPSLIGTLLLRMGDCDALLCGTVGKYQAHLQHVANVIGRRPDAPVFAAMNGLLLPNRTVFICDTYVNRNPSAEELVEIARLAADEVRRFGLVPKVAMLSPLQFRSDDSKSARKMREARDLLAKREPGLEVDGRNARRCGAVGGHPQPRASGFQPGRARRTC